MLHQEENRSSIAGPRKNELTFCDYEVMMVCLARSVRSKRFLSQFTEMMPRGYLFRWDGSDLLICQVLSEKEYCMPTYEEVREFCIRKLARILSECVACSHEDREKLDRQTAEAWVDEHKAVMDCIYDCFEAATFTLPYRDQGFERFDQLCGRAVWDSLFQPLKRELRLSSQPTVPHYTHIRFL